MQRQLPGRLEPASGAERAASAFGLTLVVVDASNRNYERAFAKIAAERDRVTEERPHAEERLS